MTRNANGEPILDLYGDIHYEESQTVKCRKRRDFKEILTMGGTAVRSQITYTLDSSIKIDVGDLLDGKPVVDFYEYVNENGVCEGYKAVV